MSEQSVPADPYCPEHGTLPTTYDSCSCVARARLTSVETDDTDRLARALCAADGMVFWTDAFPARYRTQAQRLIETPWMRDAVLRGLSHQPCRPEGQG